MKINHVLLCILVLNTSVALLFGCGEKQPERTGFSFAFITDTHIKHDSTVITAFNKAIDSINNAGVDFVISGGDQVYDVMRGNQAKGDSLFTLYKTLTSRIEVPVHNTVGNHELFGIYEESPEDSTHADYKYGMFTRYLGDTYYSFDHKGWHFVVLNTLDVEGKRYIGRIGAEQLQWLKDDLAALPAETPVAVVVHLPLVSAMSQLYPKRSQPADGRPLVQDRDSLLAAFDGHNLKLVLQGHLHWFEHLNVENKTHFITGGSIAGRPSWRGTNHGPRGFLVFDVDGEDFDWRYVAYE